MANDQSPEISRKFSLTVAKHVIIILATFLGVGACFWFILPVIQAKFVPHAPGGAHGPWVVRPHHALRFGASAFLTCMTAPFIIEHLKRKWKQQDGAVGRRNERSAGRLIDHVYHVFNAIFYLTIYASALMFYLLTWETVGQDGIEEHLPWITRLYAFEEIVALKTIPDGERSAVLKQNGPWYSIQLLGGGSISWCLDNEGMTQDELTAMTTHIAERTGLPWEKWSDERAN